MRIEMYEVGLDRDHPTLITPSPTNASSDVNIHSYPASHSGWFSYPFNKIQPLAHTAANDD